jgi:hypothetical protein
LVHVPKRLGNVCFLFIIISSEAEEFASPAINEIVSNKNESPAKKCARALVLYSMYYDDEYLVITHNKLANRQFNFLLLHLFIITRKQNESLDRKWHFKHYYIYQRNEN